MGIFNKNKKVNEFKEPQAIDGGNLYDTYMQAQAQKEIDMYSIINRMDQNDDKALEDQINAQTLQTYYVFEKQIDYFINTIDFKTDDSLLFSNIKTMLRCAVKNGKAGLYYKDGKFIPCGVNKVEYSLFNEPISATITPLNDGIVSFQNEEEYKELATLKINDINNLTIFKWGSGAISGWITLWKMCLIQQELLTMINVDKYSYIKKFIYKQNNPKSTPSNEMRDYFNPRKVYIKVPKGVDISNRLEINEQSKVIQPNILVEYYKQVMGVYYSLLGRRTNNDYKKERSVTQEIGLTNDNYIVLEKDWIDEFKIFTQQLKSKYGIVIEVNEDPLRFEKAIDPKEEVEDDI